MKASVLVILLALMCCSASVCAQVEIKRDILEDCPRAMERFITLDGAARCNLVPYLELVLKRVLDQGQAAVGSGVTSGGFAPPAGSAPPFAAGEFLRSLDPQKEEEAKACAAEMLLAIDNCALEALPELVGLAQRPGISSELARKAAEAAVTITRRSRPENAAEPSADTIAELVEILRHAPEPAVRSVLLALGEKAVPALFDGLLKPGEIERDNVARLLAVIDRQGKVTGPRFFELLRGGDESQRSRVARVLADLKPLYSQSVSEMVRLAAPLEVEKKAPLLSGIRRIFEHNQGGALSLDPQALELVVAVLQNGDPAEQAVYCLGLRQISAGSPAIVRDLVRFVSADREEIRVCAILALGHAEKLSESDFSRLLSLLYDKDPEVRLAAVEALGFQRSRRDKVLNAFLKLLKPLRPQKDALAAARLIDAVCAAVLTLDATAPALAPFLTQYLGLEFAAAQSTGSLLDVAPVRVLARTGKPAAPALFKALKDPVPLARKRAIFALDSFAQPDEKSAGPLVELLEDPDESVRLQARQALLRMGQLAAPALRQALGRKSRELRFAAAGLLLDMQIVEDSRFAAALLDGLGDAGCQARAEALIKLPAGLSRLKAELASLLEACLNDPAQLDQITREAVKRAMSSS